MCIGQDVGTAVMFLKVKKMPRHERKGLPFRWSKIHSGSIRILLKRETCEKIVKEWYELKTQRKAIKKSIWVKSFVKRLEYYLRKLK